MITINLLSPEQKNTLKTKRAYLIIRELIMLVLLFTSFLGILLLMARYTLEKELTDLVIRNINTITISQETNEQIASFNKKIELVDQIQKNFFPWSKFFSALANLTPANISYELIKVYQDQASIELQGLAQNRASLLKLKENLDNSPLFEKVNLPLENLLNKENNNFRLQAQINLNNIK